MPIGLEAPDHRALDTLLEAILEAHASGRVSLSQARSALAHVFTAAAIQNEGEVRAWLKPETFKAWMKQVHAGS
jgi:hypothetical protein